MPVERHEQDHDEEIRQLRAEVAALKLAVPQIRADGRAEGWRAGFAEGHAAGLADEAPPPPPRTRHLRVVGAAVPAFAAARRVLGHKAALAGAALLVVAAPSMNLAPWIAPPPHPAASPVITSPAGWGPPGTRSPRPSPPGQGHSHSPHPTPPGHDRSPPAPDPAPSPGDDPSPSDTAESPSPPDTPQHSHAACTPPPS